MPAGRREGCSRLLCFLSVLSDPENDRWRDLDRKCPLQIDPPGAGLWERLPARCCPDADGDEDDGALWHPEAVTSLIQDLSLSDPLGQPAAAPPSKRQCRSLSFSDELSGGGGGGRPSWRPLGSRVWTPVEKRRCHSGGSVPRPAGGPGPMQRSSSFSLPSRARALASPRDPAVTTITITAGFPRHPGGQAGPGAPGGGQGDPWSPHGRRSPVGPGAAPSGSHAVHPTATPSHTHTPCARPLPEPSWPSPGTAGARAPPRGAAA